MYDDLIKDMPKQLRWIVWGIDKLGFPIVIACALLFMGHSSFNKIATSLNSNTEAVISMASSMKGWVDEDCRFRQVVIQDHKEFDRDLKTLLGSLGIKPRRY